MNKNGTAALEGKSSAAKPEKKATKKAPKKKSGPQISEIRVRRMKDGTHHIEHHYQDANGLPHHQVHEYTAPTKQDVADHMLENLPDDEAQEEAAEGEGGQAAPAAQPVTSQPQQAAPGQE